MGIQYIPGPEQLIAPAVQQITQGVMKYLDPNKDLREAMQKAMATNPELVQNMADMESKAPGTYERLGLGADIAGVLRSVPISTQAQTDLALRPGAAKTAVALQGAARATADATSKTAGPVADLTLQTTQLNSEKVTAISKIMAADPSISFDAALKTLTGETGTERAVAKAQAPAEILAASNKVKELQRAKALPADLNNFDWKGEVNNFMNGKPSPSIVALLGNPDTGKAVAEMIDNVKQERQIAAQKFIHAMPGKNVQNFQTQNAFKSWTKSGNVGTIDTWESFMFDPEVQEHAKELLSGKVKPTADDLDLLAVAKAAAAQVDIAKLTPITKANMAVKQAQTLFEKAPDETSRLEAVNSMNQAYRTRHAAFGGLNVTAEYQPARFFGAGTIVYKDGDTGKPLSADVVNTTIADPVASDTTRKPNSAARAGTTAPAAVKPSAAPRPLSDQTPVDSAMASDVANIVDGIKKSKGREMAALGMLKANDPSANKKLSNAVEKELKRQGIIK